jgi:hypothetical protein
LLLALRTTLDPERTPAARLDVELRLAPERYRATIISGRLEIARGAADDPEAVIDTDVATMRRVVFGDLTFAEARDRGAIRVEGSPRAATRFLSSFRRPPPA